MLSVPQDGRPERETTGVSVSGGAVHHGRLARRAPPHGRSGPGVAACQATSWSAAGEHRKHESGDAAFGIGSAEQRSRADADRGTGIIPGFKGLPDILHQDAWRESASGAFTNAFRVAEVISATQRRSLPRSGSDALYAHAVGSILDQVAAPRFEKWRSLEASGRAAGCACRLCSHTENWLDPIETAT